MQVDWRENRKQITGGGPSETVWGYGYGKTEAEARQKAEAVVRARMGMRIEAVNKIIQAREGGRRHYKKGQAPTKEIGDADKRLPGEGLDGVRSWPR